MYKLSLHAVRSLLILSFIFVSNYLLAQKVPKHNDVVALSKNADANVQLVHSYLDALISGNAGTARSYLASDYTQYGPAVTDSLGIDQLIESWDAADKRRINQSVGDRNLISVRIKSGPKEGEWVMGQGTFHWQENGEQFDLPFQLTAKVEDGRLKRADIYYDQNSVLNARGYVTIPPGMDPDAYMIRRVLEAETQAWLDNDGEKMGSYWADLPYAAHTVTDETGKAYDITATEIGEMVARLSTQKPNTPGTTFTTTNFLIRPNGDAAWASYEQTFHYPDGRNSVTNIESRYMEKIDGQWKISHMISIPKR